VSTGVRLLRFRHSFTAAFCRAGGLPRNGRLMMPVALQAVFWPLSVPLPSARDNDAIREPHETTVTNCI
jgi:hypothetical protein